jgi:hypothetical protein
MKIIFNIILFVLLSTVGVLAQDGGLMRLEPELYFVKAPPGYIFQAQNDSIFVVVPFTSIDTLDNDKDSTNELQILSFNDTTNELTISDGNSIVVYDNIVTPGSEGGLERMYFGEANGEKNYQFYIDYDNLRDANTAVSQLDPESSTFKNLKLIINEPFGFGGSFFAKGKVNVENLIRDRSAENELQTLSISNDSIYLSDDGGFIVFPAAFYNDTSTTNEIQTLSIVSDTITLSDGGGSIVIPIGDIDTTLWSKSGDDIYYNDGNVGIGLNNPTDFLEIRETGADEGLKISSDVDNYLRIYNANTSVMKIEKVSQSGNALVDIDPITVDGGSNASFRFFRSTNTTGDVKFDVHRGNGTGEINSRIAGSNMDSYFNAYGGNVGIGTSSPTEKLDINGNLRVRDAIYDSSNDPGTNGEVLKTSVTGTYWATDLIDDADASTTNELQDLTWTEGTRTLAIENGNSVVISDSINDADSDPTNEIQTLSISSDTLRVSGVDGGMALSDINYWSINGGFVHYGDGAQGSADIGLVGVKTSTPTQTLDINGSMRIRGQLYDATNVDGSTGQVLTSFGSVPIWRDLPVNNDNDSSNEIQTISISNDTISLSDGGGSVVLPAGTVNTDDQTLSWNSGTRQLSIEDGNTVTIADEVDDADNDPTNENQTVSAGTGISISQVGQDFEVTNTAPDQTVTINSGTNTSVTGTYPTFTVNVPSLDDADASATNEIQTLSWNSGNRQLSISDGNTVTIATGTDTSHWEKTGDDIYYTQGKVGIGDATPDYTLDVESSDLVTAAFRNDTQDEVKIVYDFNSNSWTEEYDDGNYSLISQSDGSGEENAKFLVARNVDAAALRVDIDGISMSHYVEDSVSQVQTGGLSLDNSGHLYRSPIGAYPINNITSTYSPDEQDYTIRHTGSGSITINLPSGSLYTGKVYSIHNSSTGSVSLNPAPAHTTGGGYTMGTQYEHVMIQYTGSGWIILAEDSIATN